MMHKIFAVVAAAIAAAGIAYAGTSTVNYTSSGAAPFRTTTDGSSNNLANITIWDSAAGANGLAVNASGQIGISNFPATQAVTQSGTWNIGTLTTLTSITNPVAVTQSGSWSLAANQSTNVAQMGGTSIAAGCTTTLSTAGSSLPAIVCPTMGTYVLNSTTPGSNTAANSSPVVSAQTTPVLLNAITNTSKTIKGSAGQLVMLQCGNTNTSEAYVQIYNNAAPTVGTTTPALSIPIAASSTGGFALPGGVQFATAITAAATTTATGGTAPTTALDCNASYM